MISLPVVKIEIYVETAMKYYHFQSRNMHNILKLCFKCLNSLTFRALKYKCILVNNF